MHEFPHARRRQDRGAIVRMRAASLTSRGRNYGRFLRQAGSMRIGILLATIVLTGCSESQFGGSILYLRPYNIENLTCAELKQRIDGQAATIKLKSDLREKAATDSVGSAIGGAVYGPDQNAARWTQRQYQDEAERRKCAGEPLPVAPK
jgi:hypothetical protein